MKPSSTFRALGNGTNATVVTTIISMGRTFTTSLMATVVNGSTSVVGTGTMLGGPGSTSSSGGAGVTTSAAGGAGPSPTSKSSGGLAAATKVPLAFAAAGMMGLVGVAAVL